MSDQIISRRTPSRDPTAEISDAEVDELSWRELAPAARFVARARVAILPVVLALAALAVWLDPAPWRLWLLGTGGVLGVGIALRDFLWLRERDLRPRDVPYLLAFIVAMQALVIAVTGGIESPILVILVPISLLPALLLGSRRIFFQFILLPLSVIWLFALGDTLGFLPDLRPSFFTLGHSGTARWAYPVSLATLFTFVIAFGGSMALLLRQGLRNGARAVASARLDLLETTRQQNRDLMTLSSEIAHELKNPLASIQGLAGLLAHKQPEGSKEGEQMQVLLAEVKRMGATLDEFLNFSRPIRSLALRAVHPATLVADVVMMHEGIAHKRGVALRADPGDALPVRCDPRKVVQVLVNLVQNGLEATPPGGEVIVRTQLSHAGSVRFLVEDTGPGLDPALATRLFRPGVTSKPDGSGLGLVIARAIAEQHGGTLGLEDRREGGARATLWLPAEPVPAEPVPAEPVPAEPVPDQNVPDQNARPGASPSPPESVDLHPSSPQGEKTP